MKKEKILQWLDELADKNPDNYQEYFYDDVRNYITQIDDTSEKARKLFKCKNKEEVKEWLDGICGYIVMNIDIEFLIQEYFQ